jgi:hypothetical protein
MPYTEPISQADTGLGTTFERWALNRLLLRLFADASIRTVFEGPGDGMTGIAGINSLMLGVQGMSVTLLMPHAERAVFARSVWAYHAPKAPLVIVEQWNGEQLPFRDGEFDLAWNFNVMTRQVVPQTLLAELCRVSRRYVFICVPNRFNYSFWLHRLHHRVAGQPWEHGRVDLMQPQPWQPMFSELGLVVRKTTWVDCPWWPDIVDIGQLLGDFFPFLKRWARRASPTNRYCWTVDRLPYYRPDLYPEVHQHMARLAYFENSSHGWFQRCFAHHVGILAERG